MAASAPTPERDFYTRRLIYSSNKSLVESRCCHCGTLIIGSATQRLIADELEHMVQCLQSQQDRLRVEKHRSDAA
jgi:hypothetical protein